MEYPLQFGRQTWKLKRDGELTLFLPTTPKYGVSFLANLDFVPPWLEDEDYESEHRTMNVTVDGYFPGLKKWHELDGFELAAREAVESEGEVVTRGMEGPEIQIWSSGEGPASIHTHARDGWETRMKLEYPESGSSYTFLCELEAFFPSARARQANLDLCVKELFGELDFSDEEKARLLEEGWRFHYRGPVRLDQFSCIVPLNVADPIGWAQRIARDELGMERFGFSRVNGGEMDGSFKPEDGICAGGRLVLLSPPSVFYYEWLERRKKKP